MILRSSAWRDGLKVEVESLDRHKLEVGIVVRCDQELTRKAEFLYTAEPRTVEFSDCSDDDQRYIVEPEMRRLCGVYNYMRRQ